VNVILARENGFCFGVKKAVELTEAAAERGGAVYNLGQVVHNPIISERLKARGVAVISKPGDAPEGTVVIRAHGVPPEVRKEIEDRGLECIDATCSLVLRAQRFTKQLADEGYKVVILGTPTHPEVVGLVGFAGDDYVIVETKEEWEKLPRMKRTGVVSQSTQPPWAFKELVSHLTDVAQELKVFNTVCPVTVKRARGLGAGRRRRHRHRRRRQELGEYARARQPREDERRYRAPRRERDRARGHVGPRPRCGGAHRGHLDTDGDAPRGEGAH